MPTRMRPKRAAELVGGSLYWIVKHRIVARQEILRFEDREDGRIDIVCSAELVPVSPMPRRAHQGWRYLEEADAPPATTTAAASARCRRGSTASWQRSRSSRSSCRLWSSAVSRAQPEETEHDERDGFSSHRRARSPSAQCSSILSTRPGPKAACSLDTLRAYARQYFHHVEAFPRAVSAVHSACPDRDGRRMLAENLAEEEGIEAGKQDHATPVADVRLRPRRKRGGGPRARRSIPRRRR